MILPCRCRLIALSLQCHCHCHAVAMSLQCHVITMFLPCNCYAIATSSQSHAIILVITQCYCLPCHCFARWLSTGHTVKQRGRTREFNIVLMIRIITMCSNPQRSASTSPVLRDRNGLQPVGQARQEARQWQQQHQQQKW